MPNVHDFALKRLHGKSLHNKEEMEYLDLYKQMAMGIPLSSKEYDRAGELATKFTQATVDEQDARDRSPYKHVLNAVHSASQSGDPTDAMLIPAQVAGKGIGEIYRAATGDEDAASLADASATIGASLINPKQLVSFVTKMSKATAATSELKALISEAKAGNAAARSALEEIKAKNPSLVGNAVGEMNEARAAAARPKGNVPTEAKAKVEPKTSAKSEEIPKEQWSKKDIERTEKYAEREAKKSMSQSAPVGRDAGEEAAYTQLDRKYKVNEHGNPTKGSAEQYLAEQRALDKKFGRGDADLGKPMDKKPVAEKSAQEAAGLDETEGFVYDDSARPPSVDKSASTNKPMEAQGGSSRPSPESPKAPQDNSGKSAPANPERVDPSDREGLGPETKPKNIVQRNPVLSTAVAAGGVGFGAGALMKGSSNKQADLDSKKTTPPSSSGNQNLPASLQGGNKTSVTVNNGGTPGSQTTSPPSTSKDDEAEARHNREEEQAERIKELEYKLAEGDYNTKKSQAQQHVLDSLTSNMDRLKYNSSHTDEARKQLDESDKSYKEAVDAQRKFDETPYEHKRDFWERLGGLGAHLRGEGNQYDQDSRRQAREEYNIERGKRKDAVTNAEQSRRDINARMNTESNIEEGRARGEGAYYDRLHGLGLTGLSFLDDPSKTRAADDLHDYHRSQVRANDALVGSRKGSAGRADAELSYKRDRLAQLKAKNDREALSDAERTEKMRLENDFSRFTNEKMGIKPSPAQQIVTGNTNH